MEDPYPGQPEPFAADHHLLGIPRLGFALQRWWLLLKPAEVVLGGQLAGHAPPVKRGGLAGGHP